MGYFVESFGKSPYYIYDFSFSSFLRQESLFFGSSPLNFKDFTNWVLAFLIPTLFLLQMYQGYFFWKLGVVRSHSIKLKKKKPIKKENEENENEEDEAKYETLEEDEE